MKGIMSIVEVMITGIILFAAFLHFFPQYAIRTRWDSVLLKVKVRDTLKTIDRLNKTYDFATNSDQFKAFMNATFLPEAAIWWREVSGDIEVHDPVPYFTKGYRESMVDVVNTTEGYKTYSFTLGLGYPF